MDDALVWGAPEKQGGVPLLEDERPVHKRVYVGQQHREALVCADLLYCKTGPAPDVLGSLGLDAAGKFSKCLDLKEGIPATEGNIGDGVRLDDVQDFVYTHPFAVRDIPGLRIMTAPAVVRAAGAVYRRAQTRAVGHGLLHDFEYGNFIRARHGP